MKRLFSGLLASWTMIRLSRRARRHPDPKNLAAVCLELERRGRLQEAVDGARRGLERFPHSRVLQDVLRVNSRRLSIEEIARLEHRLRKRPFERTYRRLVECHLRALDPDAARRVAERMLQDFPESAGAQNLLGKVYFQLFVRDHLAEDGERAIRCLKRATELDGSTVEPRLLLAEAFYEIGATSKAMIHLLMALQLDPGNEEARRLHEVLGALPPEREEERDLLTEAEENDQPWVARRGRLPGSARAAVARGVQQLSLMAGVGRVVLSHQGIELVARRGGVNRPTEHRDVALLQLATGFRRSASLAVKRMGLGAVEEALITMREGIALAFAAGTTVLLVTSRDHPYADVIAQEARAYLASWTAARSGAWRSASSLSYSS